MTTRAVWLATFLVWATFVFSSPQKVFAQSSDELIEQGVELRRQDRHLEALELFERAYALAPSMRALGQVALAEHALGHYAIAAKALRVVLGSGDSWALSRSPMLRAALDDSESRLGTVEVVGCSPGDEVRIDGRVVGLFPLTERAEVPVGRVDVGCFRDGEGVGEARAAVRARGVVRVEVFAPARPAEEAVGGAPGPVLERSELSTDGPSATWRTAGMSLVISGAVVTGAGVVLHVIAESAASEFRSSPERCPERYAGRSPGCDDLYARVAGTRDGALGAYLAGGALLVTGALLWWLAPSHASDTTTSQLRCVPSTAGTGGAYVTCEGTF